MRLCGAPFQCKCGTQRECRRSRPCPYHTATPRDYRFLFVLPNEKDDGWRVGERAVRKIGGAA